MNELLLLEEKFGNCSERPVKSPAGSCCWALLEEHHCQSPPLSKSVDNNFDTMEMGPPPPPPFNSNNASLLPPALFEKGLTKTSGLLDRRGLPHETRRAGGITVVA